ncbi:MAG TPA: hypothetical protein VLH18_08515 [Candidatus Limnocylindrales bacterium]|nr:hypothetical protein [Candidatus Limnocylindrales bacterium]
MRWIRIKPSPVSDQVVVIVRGAEEGLIGYTFLILSDLYCPNFPKSEKTLKEEMTWILHYHRSKN